MKIYPDYTIWQMHVGCYEVIRVDSATSQPVVVQTNIPTRAKAYEAMFNWRARAKANGERNDA